MSDHEIAQIERSTLPQTAARALVYAVVYVITLWLPSLHWLWYVLAGYLLFDIGCTAVVLHLTKKLKKLKEGA